MKRTLVVGWFSYPEMGATAGDLFAADLVSDWLSSVDRPHDVAKAAPFEGGVDLGELDPLSYSELIFVCGPFGNGWPITEMLSQFAHCRLIGIDLSMLQPLDEWNPFDLLIERDSSVTSNPDITFLSGKPNVPLIGVILVHPQEEYGDRALHGQANEAISNLLDDAEAAPIPIDTRLDRNATGFRTPRQVESVIKRMDAVVTTRLHGCVLALKNGVPPVAIDPIAGGAKISRQMSTIGWPIVFSAEELDPVELEGALSFCLSEEARALARECATRAAHRVEKLRERLLNGLD
jgi:hypothetical protein